VANRQRAVAFDERGIPDLDTADVGDGIEGPWGSTQFDTEITGAGRISGHFLIFPVGLAMSTGSTGAAMS
jgi:hypothetical protein